MNSHKLFFFICGSLLIVLLSFATTNALANFPQTASSYGGTYSNWPTSWKAVPALNDPDDGFTNARIDFVGDATDPGFYIAGNTDYCFFRIRVDDGAATEFSDTHMILIDKDQNGTFDYAISWDSQSNNQTQHGLEMEIAGTIGASWATTNANDVDGNNGSKIAPPDFGLSNGDGYIRILNNQSTTNFGTTTLIDIAVKWSYLTTNTTLAKGQTWNVQLGSIDQANDHNWIDDDVAGNRASSGAISFPGTIGFSASTAVQLTNIDGQGQTSLPFIIAGLMILILFMMVGYVDYLRANKNIET